MSDTFERAVAAACRWADQCEQLILSQGQPLSPNLLNLAARIGVQHPSRIRLMRVEALPAITDAVLQRELSELGILTPTTGAITVNYGIMMRLKESNNHRLMVRQLGRVGQFERLKTTERFMKHYLWELDQMGNACSALEMEVRVLEELFGGERFPVPAMHAAGKTCHGF